jgi:hypothetical protein
MPTNPARVSTTVSFGRKASYTSVCTTAGATAFTRCYQLQRTRPNPYEVGAFFDDQINSLQRTLKEVGLTAAVAARRVDALLAGLEGALIIANSRPKKSTFVTAPKELVRAAMVKVP